MNIYLHILIHTYMFTYVDKYGNKYGGQTRSAQYGGHRSELKPGVFDIH